jgi:oxygen-dependent protoporphyrinogen oxidase
MAQYPVGHLDCVAEIEALITRLPGFALAGNAYRGIGIPDCVRSGEEAAQALVDAAAAGEVTSDK